MPNIGYQKVFKNVVRQSSIKSLTEIIFLRRLTKISRPLWFIMALGIDGPIVRHIVSG